mmetsp:Transcript_31845/g.62196  ORF Transcript_31845/g.62196 Transcript_31845/m.62196 type:complete len:220 (-) Transcript_31845:711-1370(-)
MLHTLCFLAAAISACSWVHLELFDGYICAVVTSFPNFSEAPCPNDSLQVQVFRLDFEVQRMSQTGQLSSLFQLLHHGVPQLRAGRGEPPGRVLPVPLRCCVGQAVELVHAEQPAHHTSQLGICSCVSQVSGSYVGGLHKALLQVEERHELELAGSSQSSCSNFLGTPSCFSLVWAPKGLRVLGWVGTRPHHRLWRQGLNARVCVLLGIDVGNSSASSRV